MVAHSEEFGEEFGKGRNGMRKEPEKTVTQFSHRSQESSPSSAEPSKSAKGTQSAPSKPGSPPEEGAPHSPLGERRHTAFPEAAPAEGEQPFQEKETSAVRPLEAILEEEGTPSLWERGKKQKDVLESDKSLRDKEIREGIDSKEASIAEGAPSYAALLSENTELKERVLRAMADMENLRRRTAREIKEGREYAITSFARDIISVSDNLRRALEAISEDLRAEGRISSLIEGVEMTEREMLGCLEKHGVCKFSPKGERFDPHFHQAMFEVPDLEHPNGTVVHVMQPGYMIGSRVLRPALVGVSKASPLSNASESISERMSGD